MTELFNGYITEHKSEDCHIRKVCYREVCREGWGSIAIMDECPHWQGNYCGYDPNNELEETARKAYEAAEVGVLPDMVTIAMIACDYGNAHVLYDEFGGEAKIHIKQQFQDLLRLFKRCHYSFDAIYSNRAVHTNSLHVKMARVSRASDSNIFLRDAKECVEHYHWLAVRHGLKLKELWEQDQAE